MLALIKRMVQRSMIYAEDGKIHFRIRYLIDKCVITERSTNAANNVSGSTI